MLINYRHLISNLKLQMYYILSGWWKKVKSFVDLNSLPGDSQAKKFVWYLFFSYVVVDITHTGRV